MSSTLSSPLIAAEQRIVIDLARLQAVSFTEAFYTALKKSRRESADRDFPFSLSQIFHRNPHAAAPFINEAVQWKKLCDLLLLDHDPDRETVLVLKNADQATPKTRHQVERAIRFHELHGLNRRFEMDEC